MNYIVTNKSRLKIKRRYSSRNSMRTKSTLKIKSTFKTKNVPFGHLFIKLRLNLLGSHSIVFISLCLCIYFNTYNLNTNNYILNTDSFFFLNSVVTLWKIKSTITHHFLFEVRLFQHHNKPTICIVSSHLFAIHLFDSYFFHEKHYDYNCYYWIFEMAVYISILPHCHFYSINGCIYFALVSKNDELLIFITLYCPKF